MYKGLKKNDQVFLVAQKEIHSEEFSVKQCYIWRKGRSYIDVDINGMSIRFKDDETIGSDIFGRLYFLFKTEKESNDYIKQRKTKTEIKEKILNVIYKCNLNELEDIYLYLESRYPNEMR